MSYSSMKQKALTNLVYVIIALVIVVIVGGRHLIRGESEITVSKTEQRCESGSNCKYLVFTDKGVFENVDSKLLELKWNSSDIYGQLLPGKRFRIDYYGVRFGLFSWYPNIVDVEAIQ